jgi:hypothetical protein
MHTFAGISLLLGARATRADANYRRYRAAEQ